MPKFFNKNVNLSKKAVLATASVFAVAGIVIATVVPVVQVNNSYEPPHETYGQGIYFDDYHYVPETAHNHDVMDEEGNKVGNTYYQSNLLLNVDGNSEQFGESLFEDEQWIGDYAWVNPFLLGTSTRYNSAVQQDLYKPNGYVSSAGKGSYSNELVDLTVFNTITEYYFTNASEELGEIRWYSLEYVEQFEVTRMFDTNGDGVRDSGIEIVLDEALVLFDNYSNQEIGYFNLTTANLFIDGVEYDLLNADEIDNIDEVTATLQLWTWWGFGAENDPTVDNYIGTIEGALGMFAINSSLAGLDTTQPLYTTSWVTNWFMKNDESEEWEYSIDGEVFNNYMTTINAAEKAKAVTKL